MDRIRGTRQTPTGHYDYKANASLGLNSGAGNVYISFDWTTKSGAPKCERIVVDRADFIRYALGRVSALDLAESAERAGIAPDQAMTLFKLLAVAK